ncbi:diguanylate cyclase [Shewanella sp. GXUN23E]|uniref:sensor domain-containing diguanylate cyclase n=1 Tax=Shewanella sp. GXUN23E TaxID=3422498 RepID=UPI003D7CF75D
MHRLLTRQLKKVFGQEWPDDPRFRQFVELIDQAYLDFCDEQQILERSIDVSSRELNAINTNLSTLLNAMPDICLWVDKDNRIWDVRGATGIEDLICPGETGQSFTAVVHPDISTSLLEHLEGVRNGVKPDTLDIVLPMGTDAIYLEARFASLSQGQMLIVIQDATVRTLVDNLRNQAFEDSRVRQQQLQDLINTAPIGIVITTPDNQILMVNQYALDKFNVSADEVVDTSFTDMIPIDRKEKYLQFLANYHHGLLSQERDLRMDVVMMPERAEHFVAEIRLSTLSLEGETIITQTFLDISERKNFETKLRQLAQTDPLTGANNRRYFQELAEVELVNCGKQQRPFSLMLMDLDKFKQVNDNYGHAMGDEVLKAFAKLVQGLIREGDIFGRFGGEEFILALPATDTTEAMRIAERIRVSLAESKITHGTRSIQVTTSMGLVCNTLPAMTLEEMTKAADDLLYQAKSAGRNRIMV